MRKPICPIGLECPEKYCPNRSNCKDLTHSWEIPYYFENEALIVKQYGWRTRWHEEAQLGWGVPERCTLPSGDYERLDGNEHEYEMKERLNESWLLAEWAAAIALTEKPLPPSTAPLSEPEKAPIKLEVCPYCESKQIYRKQRESFTLHCDNCGHSWKTDHCKYRGFEIKIGEKAFELPTEDGRILRFYYHCLLDENIQEWGETETINEALEKAKEDIDYLIDFY